MQISELVGRLQRLGFEPEEATVYVKLLQNGPSRASTLSSLSDLNRTKVYRVLDNLVDQRYASASVGRPTIYRAQPPRKVFAQLREDLKAEERKLERVEGAALGPLEALAGADHEVEAPDWNLIEGYPSIYEALQRCIRETEEEIVLVSNHPITTNLVPFVEEAWEAASDRAKDGVRFRAILDLDACQGERVQRWSNQPNIEVRHCSITTPLHFVLLDQAQVLQWLVMEAQGSVQMDEGAALLSDAPGLLTGARLLADHLWAQAEPVAEVRARQK